MKGGRFYRAASPAAEVSTRDRGGPNWLGEIGGDMFVVSRNHVRQWMCTRSGEECTVFGDVLAIVTEIFGDALYTSMMTCMLLSQLHTYYKRSIREMSNLRDKIIVLRYLSNKRRF